jgi:hypothetical protein
MDMKASPQGGYSADVKLSLIVGDRVIPLAQVGPQSCIAREVTCLPPSSAELVVSVDGHIRKRTVYLVHGIRGEEIDFVRMDDRATAEQAVSQ